MASPTLTLPTDLLSRYVDAESVLSKPRATYRVQPSISPALGPQQHQGHEAYEMNASHNNTALQQASQTPAEVTVWSMNPRDEWIAIAASCGCMFMVLFNP
ncbi:hypothetical protein RSOLAG1IB_02734 [Rhizoctonia solani AG-1 IB]|uniref:Uncharacterized protein n=1 Tax=Thanatephorus cucumeris (strain AG1-IB / isolate 7/3/14) TaxID=1108050 RepID=A0A0B7FM43_THACB|nr:hypothetical protein RSOLAG1IB_02734 [Rhizoctonia solani AG-1 IB]